jgi:hypothetical protein
MGEHVRDIESVFCELHAEVNLWESAARMKGLRRVALMKIMIEVSEKRDALVSLRQVMDETERNCEQIQEKFGVCATALSEIEGGVRLFFDPPIYAEKEEPPLFLAGAVTASGADNLASLRSIACIGAMLTKKDKEQREMQPEIALAAQPDDVKQTDAFGPNADDKFRLGAPNEDGTYEGSDKVSLMAAKSPAKVVVEVKADHGLDVKALMAVGVDGRPHPIFAYRLMKQMLRTAASGPDDRLVLLILLFCFSGLVARVMQSQWQKLEKKYPKEVEKIRCVVMASSFGAEDSLTTTPQASGDVSDMASLTLWKDAMVADLREAWQANPSQKFTDLPVNMGSATLPMVWTTKAAENATLADVFSCAQVMRPPFGPRDIPIFSRSDVLLTTGANALINAKVAGVVTGSGRLKGARRHLQPQPETQDKPVKVPLDPESLGQSIFAGAVVECGDRIPTNAQEMFQSRRIPSVFRSSAIPLTWQALKNVNIPDHARYGVQYIAAFCPRDNDAIVAAVVERYVCE